MLGAIMLVRVHARPFATDESGSDRELNTEEEEEAKFKTGGWWSATGNTAAACVFEGARDPSCMHGCRSVT